MNNTPQQPKFITPPNKLKAKVGGGGIVPEQLKRAQQYINNNDYDFLPHAMIFIKTAKDVLEQSKTTSDLDIMQLVDPIMQLKANGGMFKYDLITNIADICLNFVEDIEGVNGDARDVIQAHINTITIITQNKMTGSGGNEGEALMKELQKACRRYFTKHPPKTSE